MVFALGFIAFLKSCVSCQALAEALKRNSTLTAVDLQSNNIGPEGAKAWCLVRMGSWGEREWRNCKRHSRVKATVMVNYVNITSHLLFVLVFFVDYFRCVRAWSTVAGPGDDWRSLATKQVQATQAEREVDGHLWILRVGLKSLHKKSMKVKRVYMGPLGRFWWFIWICFSSVAWYYFQWKSSHCEAMFSVEVVHVLKVFLSLIFQKPDGAEGGQWGPTALHWCRD